MNTLSTVKLVPEVEYSLIPWLYTPTTAGKKKKPNQQTEKQESLLSPPPGMPRTGNSAIDHSPLSRRPGQQGSRCHSETGLTAEEHSIHSSQSNVNDVNKEVLE